MNGGRWPETGWRWGLCWPEEKWHRLAFSWGRRMVPALPQVHTELLGFWAVRGLTVLDRVDVFHGAVGGREHAVCGTDCGRHRCMEAELRAGATQPPRSESSGAVFRVRPGARRKLWYLVTGWKDPGGSPGFPWLVLGTAEVSCVDSLTVCWTPVSPLLSGLARVTSIKSVRYMPEASER